MHIGKRLFVQRKFRLKKNIAKDASELGPEDVGCIHLAENRDQLCNSYEYNNKSSLP
jgi:hypothetical protein